MKERKRERNIKTDVHIQICNLWARKRNVYYLFVLLSGAYVIVYLKIVCNL